jgi:hypothetical protein
MTETLFRELVIRFLVRILINVAPYPNKDGLLVDAAIALQKPRDYFLPKD